MVQDIDSSHQLISLAPDADIRLRSWEDYAVLYHGAAASTYEISALMAASLDALQSGPQSLASLTEKLCTDFTEIDPSDCLEHLHVGYRELETNGIIQRLTE